MLKCGLFPRLMIFPHIKFDYLIKERCRMDYLSRLRERKEQSHMTNAEIAERSGVPMPTVTKVLNGSTANPSIETLAHIAQALGTSLDELTGIAPPDNETDPITELMAEKDTRIATLTQAYERERRERHRLMYFLAGIFAFLIFIILFDLLNGGIGYIRY